MYIYIFRHYFFPDRYLDLVQIQLFITALILFQHYIEQLFAYHSRMDFFGIKWE